MNNICSCTIRLLTAQRAAPSKCRPCRWPPGATAPPRTPLAPPLSVRVSVVCVCVCSRTVVSSHLTCLLTTQCAAQLLYLPSLTGDTSVGYRRCYFIAFNTSWMRLLKIPVLTLCYVWLYILALRSVVSVLSCVTDVGSVVAF